MSSSNDAPKDEPTVEDPTSAASNDAAEAPAGAASETGRDGEASPEERSDEGDNVMAPAGAASETGRDGEASPEERSDEGDNVADDLRNGLLAAFTEELGDAVVGSHIVAGDDLWVRVTAEAWRDAAELARNRLGCSAFCFLSAIDWLPSPWGRYEDTPFDETTGPDVAADDVTEFETGYAGGDTRFQVFLRVTNPTKGYGVTIKADVADPEAGVATLIPVYPGANWHEREAHEMYGITFVGHPHLVPLYLPGAFEGHPLRKDFPLLARQVKPWPGVVDVEPMPDGGEPDADADDSAGEPVEETAS